MGASLKESRLYPVIFMVILTVVLTAILALFYEISKDRVAAYRELSFKQDLIGLFQTQIDVTGNKDIKDFNLNEISNIYTKHFVEMKSADGDITYYQVKKAEQIIGYCYPYKVSGLWGTISMLAAVDADFSKIIGLRITNQNETPGLGGRIAEDWFQQQFTGKNFRNNDEFSVWNLIAENNSGTDGSIRQITGATISSRSVVDGLLQRLEETWKAVQIKGESK